MFNYFFFFGICVVTIFLWISIFRILFNDFFFFQLNIFYF